jgi:hypothetical protein
MITGGGTGVMMSVAGGRMHPYGPVGQRGRLCRSCLRAAGFRPAGCTAG